MIGITPGLAFVFDLGADSLDMVELAMRFEEEFNIVIEDDASDSCTAVGDAISPLQKKLGYSERAGWPLSVGEPPS